ncbi:uncharacterized protein ACRADG_011440 isoform 1-T5 [Cochliomyia hominivorax]
MADEEPSPRPFRRERNLSNRNFNKRGSNRRRFSTESHSSAESKVYNFTNSQEDSVDADESSASTLSTPSISLNATSSSMDISYSVNSDTENAFNKKSILKMRTIDINIEQNNDDHHDKVDNENKSRAASGKKLQRQSPTTPQSPDPALLGVKQKLLLFENLQSDERIILKTSKYKSKSSQSLLQSEREGSSNSLASVSSTSGSYLVKAYPMGNCIAQTDAKRNSMYHVSIDEERSEDEVESIKDEINEISVETEKAEDKQDEFGRSASIDESHVVDNDRIPVAAINKSFITPVFQHSNSHPEEINSTKDPEENVAVETTEVIQKPRSKDFPRNYRSRPKTEIISGSTDLRPREADRFASLHHKPKQSEPDDEEQIELRDKGYSFIKPILEELIKTEESYVENLWIGINNYGNIFQRNDLPIGLRGKKYVLFGNVEQIAEFHRDQFLPMLHRNKHDLKRIFDEFQQFIDNNDFYGYVLFTMNKQRSLKLCDTYKNYFKLLQTEIDDKLGINSFLVQPIQRMARYPLLLQQFITTLFKNRDYVMKPIIESCCRLEKKLRNLLTTTNESEIINDIVCTNDANEFNTFYQGKFRKVSEFHVFDHTLKRSYRSKVFIFDKCIIYTEIKGKQLIFHGRYPCEHIGITAKTKQFTLYYEHRKQQECDFIGDPPLIEQWLDLIREMVSAYAAEERRKIKELHSHDHGDHIHRKPANLSLFRDSNRFSSDSGIGNIWIVPKPEQDEATNNRTTWYAVT